jgi:homopolymeric O-antigen transport system permease protein
MSDSLAAKPIVIEPKRNVLGLNFREMIEYRYLFYRMLVRPIQVRYKQTFLGVAWALLKPLAGMLVFTLFFGRLLGVADKVSINYSVFVLAGLLPWNLVAATVNASSLSTVSNAHLITKVYFPRIFLPLSVLGWTGLDFLVGSTVLAGLMFWYGVTPGISFLLLPVLLLLIVATGLGVGILLSALNVRYRDFGQVVPFMVQTWLFLTPVIYPASVIPERFQFLANLNPLTGLISAFRASLFGTQIDWNALGISSAVCLTVLFLGSWYFSRVEDFFADVV